MTPEELRALIPALNDFTWLNAAASTPMPRPVFAAVEAHLREFMERGDGNYPGWVRQKDEARAHVARFLHCTPGEVSLVQSTSFGFHVIGQLLRQRGITEVLTLESEFPSTTLPFLYDGLTLRGVLARADGTVTVDDLERALTPKTGAIAVSAVQYASGFRVDLKGVSELCRSRGLAFAINAAQGLGHVPLDVTALNADFLAATGHKWAMAGFGASVLFIAKRWLETTRLPFGGWLSVEPSEQFQPWVHATRTDDANGFTAQGTTFRREASALEAGVNSLTPWLALDAALTLHDAVGPEVTLAHLQKLQTMLRGALRKRGFVPNLSDDPATLGGICTVPVAGVPLEVVRALLREAKVATTPRGGGVRFSTHVYNTEEDVLRAVAAIDRLGIRPAV